MYNVKRCFMLKKSDTELITAIIVDHSITKAELARKLNISRQFLQQIYGGEKRFTLSAFNKLQKLYPEYFNDKIEVPDKITADDISALRKHLHLTQTQMADKLNISQALLAKYESGTRNVSKFTAQKLKDIFNGITGKLPYCPSIRIPCDVVIPVKYDYLQIDNLLISKHKINPDYSYIVSIQNNSLSPLFYENDLTVIDLSKRTPEPGNLYLVEVSGGYFIVFAELVKEGLKCTSPIDRGSTFTADKYDILANVARIRL